MKAVIIYIIFFSILHVSSFAQLNQYTSTKFAVKNPYEVFIGGIMKANDVNGLHQLLNVPMNPITISYSLPLKSETIYLHTIICLGLFSKSCKKIMY